jgi:hypothetical protein
MITVSRAVFLKDPAAVLRRAETEGPIVILGVDGKPHSIVSCPRGGWHTSCCTVAEPGSPAPDGCEVCCDG